MTQLLITGGWILDVLGSVWIGFILLNSLATWLARRKAPGLLRQWLQQTAEPPVNLLRLTVPTVYRGMDFAPWLTLLMIVLMKAFIFRSMIYWGMLNKPPLV